jgi:hypothetical protein
MTWNTQKCIVTYFHPTCICEIFSENKNVKLFLMCKLNLILFYSFLQLFHPMLLKVAYFYVTYSVTFITASFARGCWNQCCGSGAFLTPGSGIRDREKIRIRIRDEQPGSYFLELRNHFLGLKYFNSLMRIRDGKNSDPGPGMEKLRIRDVYPGSATLVGIEPRTVATIAQAVRCSYHSAIPYSIG